MNILYARYSKDRHPHFQMKTVIYEEDGLKKVMKQAVAPSGVAHIRKIIQNYKDLNMHYKEDVLLRPQLQDDSIIFEYITAYSLDELILEAALNKKKKDFFYYIELYKQFIDEVACLNYTTFSNTEQFVSFFNKKYPLEGLKSFITPNVDLNFDNIFILEDQEFKVLDYEWVLNFPVPVEFVAFRAINTFYYAHYSSLVNFVDISELFNVFEISDERIEHYTKMSIAFADFVGTNQATLRQNGYLKKSSPFEFKEPEIITSQLFYKNSKEDIFSEEDSIRIGVDSQTSILQFSIDANMKNFRFDPADKSSVICIEKVIAYDSSDKALELSLMDTNASFVMDSTHFFATDDPQVYFFTEPDFQATKIEITLKYIHFLEEEFFIEVGKRYEELTRSLNSLEDNLVKEREFSQQTILDYQSRIDEKQLLLQTVQDINLNLEVESKRLESELLEQNKMNNDLRYENSQLMSEKEILTNDLKISKEIISEIESTIWWRTMQKINSFGRKIKGEAKGKNK
ncbi:hypothetical protein PAECIP111892_03183 [Paenibacillus auburnensis]|uniref:Uncharacterized protein n=1 Tax=Paenibacillus auburnensis TaxID=2905649 RepID=A0ABN8GK00_9BACL|nr:hypothetical protein [Paenibacillus auburnensis]CAH1209253.1 hypothetical protein PAECIP111892_03183 [Paenibacillus auburnensis]